MANYLIIGGSSGIGKALVTILTQNQHEVYASYNTTAVNLQDNPHAHYFSLDILKEQINTEHLPEILDGLVYCPGSITLKPFLRFKEDDFINDYRLQVLGAVNTIQAVQPRLRKSKQASIVLFSTIAVQNGFNFHSLVSASKGAIEGLANALAAEFAPNIRVNVVAPSLTDTPLAARLLNTEQKRQLNADKNPLKAIGTAHAVAEAACFLLSEKSSYITGQVLHVDGGLSVIKG